MASIFKESSWKREIVAFRRNQQNYLSSNKLKNEDFTMDILQALYRDSLPTQAKHHLLLLLQEYSTILLPTDVSVEQALASLQDIFSQCKDETLKGQVLVSLTTIILVKNIKDLLPHLFISCVELLLETIRHVNGASEMSVRGKACVCLLEMETTYPCLLVSKVEHLYQLSTLEQSHLRHMYSALFLSLLSHLIDRLSQSIARLEDSCLADCLLKRTQPLLPFYITSELSSPVLSKTDDVLPGNVSVAELEKVLLLTIKTAPLALPCTTARTVLQIGHILVKTPALSPQIVESLIERYKSTSHSSLLHSICHLAVIFGEKLSASHRSHLSSHIISCLCQPLLPYQQRLMMLQWLVQPYHQEGDAVQTGFNLDKVKLKTLVPKSYEPFELQAEKLKLLSKLLPQDHNHDTQETALFLMEHLQSLVDQLLSLTSHNEALTWLLPVLYQFYTTHTDSDFTQHMNKLLVQLGSSQSGLLPHLTEFISNVHSTSPHRGIGLCVILSTLDRVMEQPAVTSSEVLQNHLLLASTAALQPHLNVKRLLQYLRGVVCEESVSSDWVVGSSVLTVCKCLLLHHNTEAHFTALGDTLHQLATTFDDLDIRNRARMYYTLLTYLSPNKLSSVLDHQPLNNKTQTLANLMKGEGYFPEAPPAISCHSALCLHRKPSSHPRQLTDATWSTDGCLSEYLKFVASEDCKKMFELPCSLTLSGSWEQGEVFAVVLEFNTGSHYQPLSRKYIPHLMGGKSEQCDVNLILCPNEPLPTQITVSALLTGPDNHTYSCDLPQITVNFIDLWLPLPWPRSTSVDQQMSLLSQLWQKFTENSGGIESVLSMRTCRDQLITAIDEHYSPYLVRPTENVEDMWLAAFLPPTSHLLCHMTLSADRLICKIATDNHNLLPMISVLLRQTLSTADNTQ